MEEILLKDNWKKEMKRWLYLMTVIAILGVALALTFWFNPVDDNPVKSILPIVTFFGGLFFITVYGVLYCGFYSIKVTKEKIVMNSLFGKVEFSFTDINDYTFKKYSKISELYQFDINVNDKNIKLYTRYYDELIKILEKNQANKNLLP